MDLLRLLKMYASAGCQVTKPMGETLSPNLPGTSMDEIPLHLQEDFEERAAILEYDGGLSTAEAEAQAKIEIINRIMNSQ
jgi:hypothetical protein